MKYSVAIIAALLALAGCSGQAHDPHVASLQTSASGAGATPSPSSDADRGVAFARCMRQHGVNIPDPGAGAGGKVQITGGRQGATKRALDACGHLMPNGKLDPSDPRNIDAMVKLARCLRRHGINVPDPTPAHPNLQMSGTQKTSHKFMVATKACQASAPGKGSGR